MFPIVTTASMRQIEATLNENGIPYSELMQRAAKAIARRVVTLLAHNPTPIITILVGGGNNGGDGLTAALLIQQALPSALVRCYLLRQRNDPLFNTVQQANIFTANAEDDADKRVLRNAIASSDLVIDALFGIGLKLPLRPEAVRVLRTVNQALNERRRLHAPDYTLDPTQPSPILYAPPIFVLAIDIPSGVDSDTGNADSNTIPADETLTFICPKRGHFMFAGAKFVGKLLLANCQIDPQELSKLAPEQDYLLDGHHTRKLLPLRPLDGHKGTFGKVLVIGGSAQYYGAVALATTAAYRVGAGIVTLASVPQVSLALAPHIPEVTWLALTSDPTPTLTEAVLDTLLPQLPRFDALLIGCGMGRSDGTRAFLHRLLAHQDKLPSLILDADALNTLSYQEAWWQQLPKDTIITPHAGEFARLAQLTIAETATDRWHIAREKAQAWQTITLLKGAHTLIAQPDGTMTVSPFKTDALAKAGTGDVLAGMIAGLRAQGISAPHAAQLGVYLHGLAGTIVQETQSSRAVLASDVVMSIGVALQRLEAP